MNASEAAQGVIDKLVGSAIDKFQLAVFVKNGNSIKTTKPTTELFEKAIKARLDDFAGVYDRRATKDMIVEDLIYAGMAEISRV